MAGGPPPPPLFHNQGNRPAAVDYRGAEGITRGRGFGGARGYSPSFVPVGGRGYGSPSFAANARLQDYAPPPFVPVGGRGYGSPSFAVDCRLQDNGPPPFVTVGGRGNGPPPFVPVGGRANGQPSFAADARLRDYGSPALGADGRLRDYGPPSFGADDRLRDYGSPSFGADGRLREYGTSAFEYASHSFATDGRLRDYGPRSFAADGRLREHGQPSFAIDGAFRDYGQHSFAVDDAFRDYGQHSFAVDGAFRDYGQRFAAAQGPASFAAEGERFAAPRGQPLAAAEGDLRDYGPRFAAAHGPASFAAVGVPDVAAGGQPLFRAPGLAAGVGKPLISAHNHGVPFPSVQVCDVPVVTITRQNSDKMFQKIKQALAQRSGRVYIALDLEYVASSTTKLSSQPHCSTQWYNNLKDFVNGGDVVQLGLVFYFDGPSNDAMQCYQLNFHIDESSGKYRQDSLDFLVAHDHVLQEYRDLGVFPEWAYADLLRHLPFGDSSVTWVTFHADKDVAFLMKLAVEGGLGMMPDNRLQFMDQVRKLFPVLYDVRVLAQLVTTRYSGGLKKLADQLCIERIGQEHFAGSDALVTFDCFRKIVKQCAEEGILVRMGLLSGAEEVEMATVCSLPLSFSAISLFEVKPDDFQHQGLRIHDTLRCNFNVVGVQVLVPGEAQSLGDSISAQDRYQRLIARLNQVHKFEVLLCFMNTESKVGYGRVWKIVVEDDHQAQGLARLLASSGATHDPTRIWVTMHGAQGIACLLRSFIAPADMPSKYEDYVSYRSCVFPSLCDLAFVSDSCLDVPVLPTGCKGDLAHMARSLGVTSHSSDLVTLLRCYICFRDRGDLQSFMPGRLMEHCCSKCNT